MVVLMIDHVQLAIPAGGEALARDFYAGILGLREVPKPANLAARGGAWFGSAGARIHLGIEADCRPSAKAHVALLVDDLHAIVARCAERGYRIAQGEPIPGYERAYVRDPFGNRIELMERKTEG
jgi:catechol 2,3-dioxygenase-like lactoylglutathione lyase family enzyme